MTRNDPYQSEVEGLTAFLRAEVVPRQHALRDAGVAMYDGGGRLSPEVLQAFAEVRRASASAGFYTMLLAEELGGGGLGFEALFRLWETLFDVCGAEYWLGHQAISHWSRGPSHLYQLMNSDFRDEVYPRLMNGELTTCFALSEPDAGSDIWRLRTVAERVDGGWLLNGTKQWSTNAPYADWCLAFVVTDRAAFSQHRGGVTGFIVNMHADGVLLESVIRMFGHAGGDEGIISFQDTFAPDRQVIGAPGEGLTYAMSGISTGRLYNSARATGLAKWAVSKALNYAEERTTFGEPLIENQAISFPLADAAMEIHAAHLMGLDTARALDEGRQARTEVSMMKTYSIEMAIRAIDHAIQVHGAMGLTNELHLTEAWQQLRRTRIADGSSEMMRIQIVKALRRDGINF
jgi:acyl-CoA dehydrogenase